ncbi:hypothetical protein C817_03277 [Dorea sp. 5-2]|nr:hypothetical protein C817_03277 [Dorea sp. 5-2]
MENNKRLQLFAILSLSMANAFVGTGISPALETIRNNFVGAPDLLIQMIVSLPSLMVIVVSFVFSAMSRRISMRGLCLIGLGLYTAGGLLGGVCSSIVTMIITRIIIGIGYGILMPLSIGMLPYFYEVDEQQKLNGKVVIWSSIASIICMIVAGYLASISWRMVFLVYLFGIPCIVLCWKYIPPVTLSAGGNQVSVSVIKKVSIYAVGIFVIFVSYFAILNNFSGIVINEGVASKASVGMIMPIMTAASLITGQYAEWFKKKFKKNTMLLIWIFGSIGLIGLIMKGNLLCAIIGLIFFGMALALAAATLNAEAGVSCKKEESLCVGTVMMFMRSFGQFISPVLFTGIGTALAIENIRLPYIGSLLMCVVMLFIYCIFLKAKKTVSGQGA